MVEGKVQTVLGDVEPSALGVTLTHEHLLIRFGRWHREAGIEPDREGTRDPRDRTPIALDNVGWVRRHGGANTENSLLDDIEVAIEEAQRYRDAGGGAIVDATNPDLARDPDGLRRIAEATGLHIVMGAGHYVNANHPLDMDGRTEEDLFAEMRDDVTEGCDGTAIKAGIIGEIGLEAPMHPNERKVLRAAARASRATGAALLIHPGRDTDAPLEAMRVVLDAGGDAERTIVGHIDRTLFDQQDMIELARSGCYVEFDLFGQESSYYSLSPIDMPNDARRIDHLQRLIAEGFGDRLLIAQDICRKTSLVRYGGEGYAHIPENVVPIMKRKGMTEEEIDAILIHNPARILTMAPRSQ
jgi:phosphotriesterase-related protein